MFENLIRVLRWVEEVNDGEMIETPDNNREYLKLKSISQDELDSLCYEANFILYMRDFPIYVANHMGEIRPIRDIDEKKGIDHSYMD